MKSSLQILILFAIALLVFSPCQSIFAQWSTDPNTNTPICTATGDQQSPIIISDGAGGTIITWKDYRNGGSNFSVYTQKINQNGAIQWTSNGVAICTTGYMYNPAVASDGAGGAIITWQDLRGIFAQRINSAGTVQWTDNGVEVAYPGRNPAIVSDGRGGAIITWTYDHISSNFDIYAQRISPDGTIQWASNGIPICIASGSQIGSAVVSDKAGGAIITWEDARGSDHDIYAQRINASGTVQWTTDGVAICTATGDQQSPIIMSDGAGGTIITWKDYRNGGSNFSVYTQKINQNGAIQWTSNGVAICTTGYLNNPAFASDGAGGAIITWQDLRGVFAQRINSAGTVQWTNNGVELAPAGYPAITSDGIGGAIITWTIGSNYDIYAQHIASDGTFQWASNGVAICTAPGIQFMSALVSTGTGHAIITWQDNRSGNYDIYAQNIDCYGNLSYSPHIHKVKDVPNDQGGKVVVLWDPSPLDITPNRIITSYTVYRGLKESALSKITALHKFAKMTHTATSGETIYWEEYATAQARWLSGYSSAVETLSDSTAKGNPMYYFMVLANTSDASIFWDSPIDSGYSVDNLSPSSPRLPKIMSLEGGAMQLSWSKNIVDPDVGGYVVYRSESSGFPLTNENILALVTDTMYKDASTTVGHEYYYRITTEDIHGNQSTPTAELSQELLAVELTSFTATMNVTSGVSLSWKTATEINAIEFGIEKRKIGTVDWQEIGSVQAHGTSNAPNEYSFTDKSLFAGRYDYRLKQIDNSGAFTYSQSVEIEITAPNNFALFQNYPNPFNPTTNISYQLPVTGNVTLKIYDMLGREVAILVNEVKEPGAYELKWNAANVPSGIYLYKLSAGNYTQTRKLVLLK
jgi:predicted lipoprotein with Yx(FWY)xxD motif